MLAHEHIEDNYKDDSKPISEEKKPFIKKKKENDGDQSSEKIYKNFVSKTFRASENISFDFKFFLFIHQCKTN